MGRERGLVMWPAVSGDVTGAQFVKVEVDGTMLMVGDPLKEAAMLRIREWLEEHGRFLASDPGGGEVRPGTVNVVGKYGPPVVQPTESYVDFRGAPLDGADMRRADLRWADMRDSHLAGSDLTGADLHCTSLARARLTGARLVGATLTSVGLAGADLSGADLTGADLSGARMLTAHLSPDTILPDGRAYWQWCADPLAGLCDDEAAVERALRAWGNHTWDNCPMHEANGWGHPTDVPVDKRMLSATFVALFDGDLLPRP